MARPRVLTDEQRAANKKAYYKKNKEKVKTNNAMYYQTNHGEIRARQASYYADKYADKTLQRKYGITLANYAAMFEAQKGCCAICGTDNPGGRHRTLGVDHCHTTKKVRELLCDDCNLSIGKFKDSPELLRKAALYIEKHRDEPRTTNGAVPSPSQPQRPSGQPGARPDLH